MIQASISESRRIKFVLTSFPIILREEQELLEWYDTEDRKDLFCKAHNQLYATALLMNHFDDGKELDGFSLQLIAGNLLQLIETHISSLALQRAT